jgi:RNA polymerase sigma-70 factor (ECF subfamily)
VAWLFGIARHKLLRSLRRGRVESRARRRLGVERLEFDDLAFDRVEALGTTPIEELLGRLPEAQANAIRARVLDDLSYRDVAARLRCSDLVARKRVSRGLAELKALMLEEER